MQVSILIYQDDEIIYSERRETLLNFIELHDYASHLAHFDFPKATSFEVTYRAVMATRVKLL